MEENYRYPGLPSVVPASACVTYDSNEEMEMKGYIQQGRAEGSRAVDASCEVEMQKNIVETCKHPDQNHVTGWLEWK